MTSDQSPRQTQPDATGLSRAPAAPTPLGSLGPLGPLGTSGPSTPAPAAAAEHGMPGRLVLWTLRRFWWAVLAGGLAFGTAATFALASLNPGYLSQARLLVGQLTGSTDSLRASASLGQTYADALGSPATLHRVALAAGLASASPQQLLSALDVTFNDKSRILTIATTWSDPARAHDVTSRMVAEVQRLRGQVPASPSVKDPTPDVQAQENTRAASGALTLIQPATVPDTRTDTHTTAVVVLAAVAGSLLVFTLLCFWMAQRYRRRLRVRAVLAPRTYLGTVTSGSRRPGRHDAAAASVTKGRRATEYAEIASRMQVRAGSAALRSVCVVGTRGGPAAAETALNLATALATPARHVTLVDPTDAVRSLRVSRPQLSVVQVESPQDESEIAGRLLGPDGGDDELLVLALPSVVSAVAGAWWLTTTDAVVLVGECDDPSIETDLPDCVDAIVRRGGHLLGVVLVRDGRPLVRLVTPPEKVFGP